jgi:hypothetical protein
MLSALSGRASYGVTKGDIFINGANTTFSKWKKVVGFVPQEDVMVRLGSLTLVAFRFDCVSHSFLFYLCLSFLLFVDSVLSIRMFLFFSPSRF